MGVKFGRIRLIFGCVFLGNSMFVLTISSLLLIL